jgi:protein-tyrosine phosphatase
LALLDDPEPLAEWVASGALLQINAASLLGLLGRDAQEMAVYLLSCGACHALASDAHDRDRRPFCLEDGRASAVELVGEEDAALWCRVNPWKIVRGEEVTAAPLRLAPRSKGARLLRKLRNLGG